MANELQLSLGQTGRTVTALLYLNGVIANGGTPVACAEYVGQGGLYQGNMPALAAAEYFVQFVSAGVVVSAGTIDWDGTTQITLQSIDVLISEIVGGGIGPIPVVITTKDASNVLLQLVALSFYNGLQLAAAGTTNVSGIIASGIALPAGTYRLSAYRSGYNPLSTSIIVVANTPFARTINLDLISITPPSPDHVTGFLTLYDDNNVIVVGDTVNLELLLAPGDGRGDGSGLRTAVSNILGLVQFVDMLPLANYRIQWSPNGDWVDFVTTAVTTQELPNIRQG